MTPFEEMCKGNGWKTTDKFITLEWAKCSPHIKWMELSEDDGTTYPYFITDAGVCVTAGVWSLEKYKESPEDIAPNLWNAYKDRMTEEELAALRKVIWEEWEEVLGKDSLSLVNAFVWDRTTQGYDFWSTLNDKCSPKGFKAAPTSIFKLEEQLTPEKESEWTDKHYDAYYTLTEKDIEAGRIKMDVYFVSKQWRTGSRDESGALWHCLKTIARFGEKNSREREIKALYAQIKCLAQIEGVVLE